MCKIYIYRIDFCMVIDRYPKNKHETKGIIMVNDKILFNTSFCKVGVC